MRSSLALGLTLALAACGGDPTPAPADGPAVDAPRDAPAAAATTFDVTDAFARAAPAGGVSAAYMTLANGTAAADTLVAAQTDAAGRVEIHQTGDVGDGLSGMTPVEGGLPVPAGETVTLAPGGYHVMLLDLQRDLVEGDSLDVTLEFTGRGTVQARMPVRGVGS